jgi:hypothetical protein
MGGKYYKKKRPFWSKPWTQSRLLSRKLLFATFIVLTLIISDLLGHTITDHIAYVIRDLVIAYLGVQGIVDYREKKNTIVMQAMQQAQTSSTQTDNGVPNAGDFI